MIHVKISIPRCSDELLERFRGVSVATVHEAMGRRGALDYRIKPVASSMGMCGRAITVAAHPADNIMLIRAVSLAQAGDVVVMNAGSIEHAGSFGEVLACECKARGMGGFVTSGSVRDSAALARLGFPVFSAGVSIRGTAKATLGQVNAPLAMGDVVVNPGDIVLGDNDGVVVVPLAEAEDVLAASKERERKEAAVMEHLRNGESLFDIYEYQKVFDRLGCVEVD
ncbi:MAG: 4-carboxy-4-hydroxy-2-oxoadipate aldolase/oxaloacetate decarboxylase [Eggerthellaceae bacterium]|nr:4-carboxy-4-hydroxy-2-oxoadipate aldolase/oxaloacetate decarboxylase [Eggerthellaceae bacterium]